MFKKRLTEEQACQQVLQHLTVLKTLCSRQFPDNETLAEQAENHVLDTLSMENWGRILQWDQTCLFATFLTVVANRMLIDFRRRQFGHHRPPEWLKQKSDPLYMQAHELLIKKQYSRTECIEILALHDANRERAYIEHLVNQVSARCKAVEKPVECDLQDHEPWLISAEPGPLAEMEQNETNDVCRVLANVFDWEQGDNDAQNEALSAAAAKMRAMLAIDDQDRLMIKMHFVDGRKLSEIKHMLNYRGDIHKRFAKILNQCRLAMKHSGLLNEVDHAD